MADSESMASVVTMTTKPSSEELQAYIKVTAEAMHANPVAILVLSSDATFDPHPAIPLSSRLSYFSGRLTALSENGAIFLQSCDYNAISIWEPPDYPSSPLYPAGSQQRAWVDFLHPMKYRNLPNEENGELKPFYHLTTLARNVSHPDGKVKGAISAVMKPILKRAAEEGVACWLEATDPASVGVYERFGFKVCETIRMGEGSVGSDGWSRDGGSGVAVFGMKWKKR